MKKKSRKGRAPGKLSKNYSPTRRELNIIDAVGGNKPMAARSLWMLLCFLAQQRDGLRKEGGGVGAPAILRHYPGLAQMIIGELLRALDKRNAASFQLVADVLNSTPPNEALRPEADPQALALLVDSGSDKKHYPKPMGALASVIHGTIGRLPSDATLRRLVERLGIPATRRPRGRPPS